MKAKTAKPLALLLSLIPATVALADNTPAVQIAYGYGVSDTPTIVVLKADGTLWQISSNNYSYTNVVPQQVLDAGGNVFSGITAVTGNEAGVIALKSDGTVWPGAVKEDTCLGKAPSQALWRIPCRFPTRRTLRAILPGLPPFRQGTIISSH